jgi:hypothetical protein
VFADMFSQMKKSRKYILILFLINILFGLFSGATEVNQYLLVLLGIVYIVVQVVFVYEWCEVHSIENKVALPGGAKILMVLFTPIGLAYYFYRAFGFGSATLKFLISIIVMTAIIVAPGVTSYIVYGN